MLNVPENTARKHANKLAHYMQGNQ